MADYIIRSAEPRDQSALAELKGSYVRAVYKGFLAKELLERIDTEFYAPQFGEWLFSDQFHTDVMEHNGQLEGYVVYGPDSDESGWGLIADARSVHPGDAERKRLLVEHTIQTLASMGHPDIHIWLVHDNFRIRFLFESLGFRRDGKEKIAVQSGQELHFVRYQHRVLPEE